MSAPSRFTPPVVLVVEDQDLLRSYAVELLSDNGFAVVEAEDAVAALRVLERRSDVDLVFTDVQMPGRLDGIELARVIRQRWPRVLLILTSGRLRPSPSQMPAGGSFIAKPYREKELIARIDETMRGATGDDADYEPERRRA